MAVGRERKTGNVTISKTKTGDFNTQRTLSGSFFVIPERLASIRAVVLAFTANKRTLSIIAQRRERSEANNRVLFEFPRYLYIYIYIYMSVCNVHCTRSWTPYASPITSAIVHSEHRLLFGVPL